MTEDDLLLEDLKSELVGVRSAAVKDELKRLRKTVYETHDRDGAFRCRPADPRKTPRSGVTEHP